MSLLLALQGAPPAVDLILLNEEVREEYEDDVPLPTEFIAPDDLILVGAWEDDEPDEGWETPLFALFEDPPAAPVDLVLVIPEWLDDETESESFDPVVLLPESDLLFSPESIDDGEEDAAQWAEPFQHEEIVETERDDGRRPLGGIKLRKPRPYVPSGTDLPQEPPKPVAKPKARKAKASVEIIPEEEWFSTASALMMLIASDDGPGAEYESITMEIPEGMDPMAVLTLLVAMDD